MGLIIKVDDRPYRTIAQENWGLTDEQMIGMHVHHRLPKKLGGTNDPSNLYVCSPWFHFHVWHKGHHRGILSSGTKGKKYSDESKAKMSSWQKGKPKSEETKQRMSEAAKKRVRKPWSEETRRKMSQSAKRRWSRA